MPRAAKTLLRMVALVLCAMIVIALHLLLPDKPMAFVFPFFACLAMALLLALALFVASFMIGSAPGRSKLGQRLTDKVDQQTEGSNDAYQRTWDRARAKREGTTPASVRQPPPK